MCRTHGVWLILTLLFTFFLLTVDAAKLSKNSTIGSREINDTSISNAEIMRIIHNMEQIYSLVYNYSSIFVKQERIKGKLSEKRKIKVLFKKPFNLYMKWLNGSDKGMELVYRRGYNDNKMLVKTRILWKKCTLSMEPTSERALKGNRHTINEMGIGYIIKLMMENVKRAEENKELKLVYNGDEKIGGRTVYKIECILPSDKSKGYYCYRAILGIDKKNGLPVMVGIYLWDNQLYERYVYSVLQTNIGIKDNVFDF